MELADQSQTIQILEINKADKEKFLHAERKVLKKVANFCNRLPFSGKLIITPAVLSTIGERNPYYKTVRTIEATGMLGVMGVGDIGDFFSDRKKKFKGMRSHKIIEKILEKARKKGWVPSHVDSVIVLENPKLGIRKKAIQKRVARMLKLDVLDVSIKAKTSEGLGPEGEGLAISSEALVAMRKVG